MPGISLYPRDEKEPAPLLPSGREVAELARTFIPGISEDDLPWGTQPLRDLFAAARGARDSFLARSASRKPEISVKYWWGDAVEIFEAKCNLAQCID